VPVKEYRWVYIKIELQIGERIVDYRTIRFSAYERIRKLFRTRAIAQKEEWFIYITYERNYKRTRSKKLFDILHS
jgi:hypothetical protein